MKHTNMAEEKRFQATFLAVCAGGMWFWNGSKRVVIADERQTMKQMAFSRVLTVVACVLALCLLAPTVGRTNWAQYIYDDLHCAK